MGEQPRVTTVRARRVVAGFAAFALVLVGAGALSTSAAADTAPPAGTPATVSADPLPTVQQDGVVYSQVTVGNIVYATGSFSETWPSGQAASASNETARSNLLAYNITTGALVTSFDHSLNAQGLGVAASPDGKTVYVVGDFTTVDGATHNHIAAFDTGTGTLVTGFDASLSAEAAAVAVTSTAVYVGGNFFSAGDVSRTRLAAFAPGTGALLAWAPTADDGQVAALAVVPSAARVIVGGRFTTLDGQPASGMGALDATSGTIEPWAINGVVQDSATGSTAGKCGITNLSVAGTTVYGGGFAYGCGNFEGTFSADAATGNINWINDCHGDTYSTMPVGSVLYVASHSHDCSAIGAFPDSSAPGVSQRATAYSTTATGTDIGPDVYKWDYSGQPDSSLLDWFPTLEPGTFTQQDQAAWSVTGNAEYIAYGGEFPTVNGTAQQGLVRFAVKSIAPNKIGPIATTSGTTLVPTVSSTLYGRVDLSWTATWDRDNANLTYTILRDGTAVGTITQASTFWQLPTITYADTGLTPGTSHTYRIRVTDPLDNSIGSATSQAVTVSDSGGPPPDVAPTAAFAGSCTQLTCTFDASSSSDSDGSVASYAWNFGDGGTGTGVTTSHTYGKAGSHSVTLTVTDNRGGVSSPVSHPVSAVAPAAVWASDAFQRTVKSGWGKAAVGGSWSRSGCSAMSVSHEIGYLVADRAKNCSTWLQSVSRSSADTSVAMRAPSLPEGGLQVAVIGRRISAATDIRLRLELEHNGSVAASLVSRVGSKTTALSRTVTVRPASDADGRILVSLSVTGTSPTLVRAKVWQQGTTEPSGWTVTGKTSTPALQHHGGIGLSAYLATAHNPKTASLRVTSVISRQVLG